MIPGQPPTQPSPGISLAQGLDDTVVELLFANARTGEVITLIVAITLAAAGGVVRAADLAEQVGQTAK